MSSEDLSIEESAEVAAEKLIDGEMSGDRVEVDKQNEFDEKLETDLNTDGVWSEQEIEYLKNNSQNMSNDELKEFFMKNSDFQETKFERFSRSEKKYVMKNFPAQNLDTIADQLNRPVEEVEKKIEMLGLGHELK
ncbi:hypothetical protein [Candidatus Nanohalobium constans]|nr:hypothetical protein [Candidatus Nanohalobium constans]